MSNIKLDTLLQAFHNAVLEAQRMTEQQHIEQLDRYFEWPDDTEETRNSFHLDEHVLKARGKAKTWKVLVPSLKTEAQPGDMDEIEVPLLSLIPPSSIKIKSMVVEFKVGLNEISVTHNGEKSNISRKQNGKDDAAIGVDLAVTSGGLLGKKPSIAKVRIEFDAGEPPESFLRVNDHLIKSIV